MQQLNITLNEQLIQQAQQHSGISQVDELLDFVLRDFIVRQQSNNLLDLYGKDGIQSDYDYKKLRVGAG